MINLSIITVVLNDKIGIFETLTSLKRFDKESYEHVVIDGGSTDGTLDVLKSFSNRVDVLISESDKGIYDAMNKGVLRASESIICFLNAGDVALDGYIDHPVRMFSKNSSIDYCYGGVLLHGKRDKVYLPRVISATSEYLQAMPFPHPSLFVKKKLFNKIGYFDLSKKITADHEWIVRMILFKAKGVVINHSVVKFSLDGASLSHYTSFEMYQTAVKYGRNRYKAGFYCLYSLLAFVKYKLYY